LFTLTNADTEICHVARLWGIYKQISLFLHLLVPLLYSSTHYKVVSKFRYILQLIKLMYTLSLVSAWATSANTHIYS